MSQSTSLMFEPLSFIAGAFSGACGIVISQPFDIIKVRLQNSGGNDLSVFINLLKYEGVSSLWKGSGSALLGACGCNALSFGVVENCKRLLMVDRTEPLTIWHHALCGFLSGFSTSFISAPTENARIKLQTQPIESIAGEIKYKSGTHFIIDIIKKNGLIGLYRGYWTTLFRDTIGDSVFFAVYQAAPKLLFGGELKTEERGMGSIIIGGGVAGIAYWTTIYPIDTVKSRIQADLVHNPIYKGNFDCLLKTFKSEGIRGLYAGYLTCILRAFPLNIGLVVGFEFAMKFVGRDY